MQGTNKLGNDEEGAWAGQERIELLSLLNLSNHPTGEKELLYAATTNIDKTMPACIKAVTKCSQKG